MKNLKELIENNKEEFKQFNPDLVDLIIRKCGEDEIEDSIEEYDLRDTIDYDGSLHELIDSEIEIYNHPLREWAVDNYHYVEDAISEGLCEGTDYHASIQAGQYLFYSEQYNNELESIVESINELIENNQ